MTATSTSRSAPVVDLSHSPYARQRPVAVNAVRFDGGFWEPRVRANAERALPAQYEQLERTGRLANFRRAAGLEHGPHEGYYFNDSDVYKWLEAAAWALAHEPATEIEQLVDRTVAEITAAQAPDGYLHTYYQLGRGAGRWSELPVTHELYGAGHLIQAGIAHHRATGAEELLRVARRFADLICATFGPASAGKLPGTDGHEEIELALVELARETGEQRYLDQACYFLDARGHGLAGGDEYRQDHRPYRELESPVGHAVRAVYLNAGAADIYAETGEPALLAVLERQWQALTTRRMYVTGGLGARHEGEAFGADHELPNARAYAETCAGIGSLMWNWRMLLLTGEARYADLLEWTLYNAVLPGLGSDGTSYFYMNPLASDGTYRRTPWFTCACCPPNVARTLASLTGYVYSTTDEGIFVHLYAASSASIVLSDGRTVDLVQRTAYPWEGEVTFEIGTEASFSLFVRLPAWCGPDATLEVNGQPFSGEVLPGSYTRVDRAWRRGDVVRLHLPLPVRQLEAHPHVTENLGRVAVTRGPLVYCLEQADNPGIDPREVLAPSAAAFTARYRAALLGGLTILQAPGAVRVPDAAWHDRLYRVTDPTGHAGQERGQTITLIPYFAWANREPSRMEVWLRRAAG